MRTTNLKRGLVDLSSLIWTSLKVGKDYENGIKAVDAKGREVIINSWQWGYDHAMKYLTETMNELGLVPRDLIICVEGINSKALRRFIYPEYKAGRDKLEGEYEQFNLCKKALCDVFLSLGAQTVTQEGIETDDVIGYFSKKLLGEVWIISGDKDVAQCVGGNVHQYRRGVRDENPLGPFPHEFIPVYLCLVGDDDEMPGAPGFGKGAFSKVMETFGVDCLPEFRDMIVQRRLHELAQDVDQCKPLQKVLDNSELVYKCWDLARLHVDKVNTMRRPLQWTVGMVKPRREIDEPLVKHWGSVTKLVSAENFDQALPWLKQRIAESPWVALDIETSTPPESDDWIASQRDGEGKDMVDVFGSELTSLQLTFGDNMQFHAYFPIDNIEEADVHNLTKSQLRQVLALIPESKPIVIQNAGGFELPVLWNTLPLATTHPWNGMLPNVIDTAIMSSYVDENESAGLKSMSKRLLNYEQQSYAETVTKVYAWEDWAERSYSSMGVKGTVLEENQDEHGNTFVKVEHKMNQLKAREVLGYGCDDTLTTSALATHFRVVMEIEGTWDLFLQVEQMPAYITARSFVQGVNFDLVEMARQEKDDDEAYDAAWAKLREYLISIGYAGTVFEPITVLDPASIKRACYEITGLELKTRNRKIEKLVEDIHALIEGQLVDTDTENAVALLTSMIMAGDVESINAAMKSKFKGEPELDLSSPTQMAALLYDRMKMPITIIGDCTPLEKLHQPDLDRACRLFKQKRAGKPVTLSEADMLLVRKKAKSDEIAINTALAFDLDKMTEADAVALKQIGIMKKVMTRRSLFYKNYWSIQHWKDGKIHLSHRQCGTVTRRYTASNPNSQQLPKKGEAVRFRRCFLPHHKDAVVVSIDYSGQELRLAAERSQDPNMLSCYVGDNLRDIHSLTGAFAMKLKWGAATVQELYGSHGPDLKPGKEADYTLFTRLRELPKADPLKKKADDLRKDSKNVNFTAQFGGGAPKIADRLIMKLTDAMLFLEARNEMFPLVNEAAKRAEEECRRTGLARTIGGALRHLGKWINSSDNSEAARAARQAWNMEIQGSAGEMVKLGMTRLLESGALERFDVVFMMQIHDELVVSVHKDHALEFIKIMHECMTAPYFDMKVPILGSISLGPNFADQEECGDWYIADNIKKALDAIFKKEEASADVQ